MDKTKYFKFLTELEEWGSVKDMSGAAPYLVQQFGELNMAQAMAILKEWNSTKRQLLNENH